MSAGGVRAQSSSGELPVADDGREREEEALHGDDAEIAALLEATVQHVPPPAPRGKRVRGAVPEHVEKTFPSIATRVCAVYEGYGDTGRSMPLVRQRAHSKAGQFNTRRLRMLQSFIFDVGGCGMSGADTDKLWKLFDEWESDGPAPPGRPKKLRDYFNNPHAMRQALADDIDEAVLSEGWYSCRLTELNEAYEAYYRAALPEIMAALSRAPNVRYWAKTDESDAPPHCRETPFDGAAFRQCEEQVLRDHGPSAFVVALHAYSDSCVVSGSRGKCTHPCGPARGQCVLE